MSQRIWSQRVFTHQGMGVMELHHPEKGFCTHYFSTEDLASVYFGRWFCNPDGYAYGRLIESKRLVALHHVPFLEVERTGLEIDHINALRHDCRRDNLRLGTRADNQQHRWWRFKNHDIEYFDVLKAHRVDPSFYNNEVE